jgi:hypothetical protein
MFLDPDPVDHRFWAAGQDGIGATIMGRNMFGPVRGAWGDEQWRGWWGGERLFDHLDARVEGLDCAELLSSPRVAHVLLVRR